MKRTIAHVSSDPSLARSREEVLRSAGYEVRTFCPWSKFVSDGKGYEFDLLVVGHSLLPQDREQVKQVFRQSNPDRPVVQLVWKIEELDTGNGHVFDIPQGPEKLLQFLAQVLDMQSKAKGQALR